MYRGEDVSRRGLTRCIVGLLRRVVAGLTRRCTTRRCSEASKYCSFRPVSNAKLFYGKEKLLFKLFFDLTCSNRFFLSVLKGVIR